MSGRPFVRVRVHDSTFCFNRICRDCMSTRFGFGGVADEALCRRADCDNHLQEGEDELLPTPLHRLPSLPEEGSTQPLGPELPFSPE